MSDIRTGFVSLPVGGRDEAFLDTFANQVRLGATISDFTIIFGVNDDRGLSVSIKDVAAIHLAPITLKMLLRNIQIAVDAYEHSVGEIPVPMSLDMQMKGLAERLRAGFRAMMTAEEPPAT